MDTNHYFGLPGHLRPLAWPAGYERPRARAATVFRTSTGKARVGKLLNAARAWSLPYNGLTRASYSWLESFDQGHMGPGPYVFLDPATRNHLSVNQSSVTSAARDTRDFSVTGTGGAIACDLTTAGQQPVTLLWSFATSTPGTSVLQLSPLSTMWPGIPVVARQYTFGFRALGGGTDGVVGLTPTVGWLDTSGASVSTSTGATINTAAGLWSAPITVTATAPATAAYALCSIAASSATINAGDKVNLTSLVFNEGVWEDWTPGTGIYPVEIIGQDDKVPWRHPELRAADTVVLQEVI